MTSGYSNVALGGAAATGITAGASNVAIGFNCMAHNTAGNGNTVVGEANMSVTTSGDDNTAIGRGALWGGDGYSYNVAVGSNTMRSTNASNNSALGYQAMYTNTSGGNNAALGFKALYSGTTGSNNTAVGYQAGYNLTTATDTVSIGYSAQASVTKGVAIGSGSAATAACVAIGHNAGGTAASCSSAGYVQIGSSSWNGSAWSSWSDARLKTDIVPMYKYGLKEIMQLEPVFYHYIDQATGKANPDLVLGVTAQNVVKLMPELVISKDYSKGKKSYLQLMETKLIFPIINAIKELKASIYKIWQAIANLETRLEALEKENKLLRMELGRLQAK